LPYARTQRAVDSGAENILRNFPPTPFFTEMAIVTVDLRTFLIPRSTPMNTGIHPMLRGIISAATLKSLENLYKFV